MKKLSIITAIMLLAVTAFAQPNQRERERQKLQDHKSEASARRSVNNPKSNAVNRRTVQNHKSEVTARRPVEKSQMERNRKVYESGRHSVPTPNNSARSNNKRPSEVVRTTNKKVNTHTSSTRQATHGNTTAHRTKPNSYNQEAVRSGDRKPVNTGQNGKGKGSYGKNNHRGDYVTPNRRHVRKPHNGNVHNTPVRYKTGHTHYRVPGHVDVIWTRDMYREYRVLYPDYHYWYYPTGYRIVNVPAYRAYFHVGELRNVYGRIHEVWYSIETDEYYLYFGGNYPYQDFSVILSGKHARRFHRNPEVFFSGRYIWVTGLVSTFQGKPEIMVMRKHQVHLY
ncbi:hypothetical protein ACFLTA_05535 [Bacteroidota bacterium]